MPRLNRNDKRLAFTVARAAYIQAHVHIKEGKFSFRAKHGETMEQDANRFAAEVHAAADKAAPEIVAEYETLP